MNKRRLKILFSLTVLFILFFSVLWLFSPLRAQLAIHDYTGLLHRPGGFARYLVIPKVSDFYRQVQKNAVLKEVISKKAFSVFFSSPPPKLISDLFGWLEILGENLQKALLGAIFPGSLLYVSSEEGSILLLEVSPAGKLLLDKSDYPYKTYKEPFYVIASTKALLKKQVEHKIKSGIASLKISNQNLAIVLDPEDDPKKEERSLTWAFYRTFFPKKRFGPQTIVFSVTEEGIFLQSLAPVYWPLKDTSYQSLLQSLGEPQISENQVQENGLFFQFLLDTQSLESLILKDKFNKSNFKLPALIFSGFLVDRDRFLPDIAIYLDRREKKLVQFLKEAFYNQSARESKGSNGETILSYPNQEYYPEEFAAFRPHYLFTKEHFLWASSAQSYKLINQWQKNLPLKKVLSDGQNNEKTLVYVKGNLLKVLKSLFQALEKVEPAFGDSSFADFRETLAQWLKSIPRANMEGSYSLSPEYLQGNLKIVF